MPERIDLRIEKLIYGGEGIGHHEGRAVFAPFVLPGEIISLEAVEHRAKFIRGRATSITLPSSERVLPECPHFGVCGGCNYQHISYEAQLRYKADILRETLSRLGRISWDGPIATHGSPPYGYRNRAQWKIAATNNGTRSLGYFEAGTRRLCPVTICPILSPRLVETLAAISNLTAGPLPPGLREVEAFVDDADDGLLVNLSLEELESAPSVLIGALREALPNIRSILMHVRRGDRFELFGPGHFSYGVGEHRYRLGHLSFFQVNRFLLPQLAEIAIGDARGRLALDLFAGVGLFTLPLAGRFERVLGVESNEAAVRDLEENLGASGIASSSTARTSDVSAFLSRWREAPDFVLLDPPRAGVPAPALQRLAKLNPRVISYLSCDPATLARDLATLVGTKDKPGRYAINELHLVDMFPQSYHLEALVRLTLR
jgi:23S rRNA (uracil1939-C5)-methyltransferase